MNKVFNCVLFLGTALLTVPAGRADDVVYRGKVTLEDGSPPGKMVAIERVCDGLDHSIREGTSSPKTGEYFLRLNLGSFGSTFDGESSLSMLPCHLEGVLPGFSSSHVDLTDVRIILNPRFPVIILKPAQKADSRGLNLNASVPHAASKSWGIATQQVLQGNWEAAEAPLREVVKVAPKFSTGWAAFGTVCANLKKDAEARDALERAIALNPKPLPPYIALANVELGLKDWRAAADTSEKLINLDTKHQYAEAHQVRAVALYQLNDFDGALAQITAAIESDKRHELPHAEFILGAVYEARKEYDAAAAHLHTYLQQNPKAKDAASVTERIANLGKGAVADLSNEVSNGNLRLAATGEAPVPAGIKAFSAIAQVSGNPSYQDFFLRYCRAIIEETSTGSNPTMDTGDALRVFITSISNLEAVGEHRTGSTLIKLSFQNDDQVRKSQNIMAEFGLKLVSKGDGFSVEPGDHPNDGLRQWAISALGIDELALRQAIEQRHDFEFQILQENARLVGGASWTAMWKGLPDSPGGPVEIFMKDRRFARVYSGLADLDGETAAAVVSAVGLPNLVQKYAAAIANYGDSLAVAEKRVVVPGGVKTQAAWSKLVGAKPENPTPFLRALFEKDQGRLLGFYFDLAKADPAHQQYFSQAPERIEAYYKWYRDSMTTGLPKTADRWQAGILQHLRIDGSGKLVFPGGREAWATGSESDDEVLLRHKALEAMSAIAVLEENRGTPFSAAAAQLLAQHYAQWRSLFPYFTKLPALDVAEFKALADFEAAASSAPAERQNLMVGEWHSLVTLIMLGRQAGSLSGSDGVQAFRQACDAMRSENPSAQALETIRHIAGDGNLDDAIASRLLRLSGAHRQAFDDVKRLQNVPSFDSIGSPPEAKTTLEALSGVVYAALLDPTYLLVAEDSALLSKHSFVTPASPGLFARSALVVSNGPPGTNFTGGFASFAEATHALHGRTLGALLRAPDGNVETVQMEGPSPEGPGRMEPAGGVSGDLVFHAGGRIVEAYATVTDSHGRYVDNLTAKEFSIVEEGHTKPIFAFEDHTAAVSVALVFDTTGSMVAALPPLKNAAMQLVENLRPTDSVAVYSFNDKVNELQAFTSDKAAAKRAILKTRAAGVTALYDALLRVNHDLATRTGKKVIIVFTDGADNASMLTADAAIRRAKGRGIPIYTIAEGEALMHPELLSLLSRMSQATGGTPFIIRKLSDIGPVFDKVSQDLAHGYLLAFQPSPGEDRSWRQMQVVVTGQKGLQIRAREGFYAE